MLLPGATIGILGGGQLGRMMAVAAAQLGYNCHIYAPEAESVAGEVSAKLTQADWHDMQALADFAGQCDVITYEFENVAAGPLAMIADIAPLRPGPKVLEIAQSRSSEKTFARACGGVTAPFALVESVQELAAAITEIGTPSILKTNRLGYDGKGQIRLSGGEDPAQLWQEIGGQPCVLEGFVTFGAEFSVILVRGLDGEVRFWDSAENVHVGGILAPPPCPPPPRCWSRWPKPAISPRAWRKSWIMSACCPANSSPRRKARCSTKWRPGCIIPATGPSKARKRASSRTTCARSAACPWAIRRWPDGMW